MMKFNCGLNKKMKKIVNKIKFSLGAVLVSVAALVLAGCEFSGKADRGVYKSIDNGESFTQKAKISEKESFANADVLSLVVDKSNPNTVYAGTRANGILRSTDGGENWVKDINNFTNVTSIVINDNNPREIYITASKGGVSKIFKTENGGENWFEPFTQSTGKVQNWTIALAHHNPHVVYAGDSNGGIYRSDDAGKSWRTLHWARSGIRKISIDAGNDNRIYFRTERGKAFKTEDGGGTFPEINTGRKVLSIQAHPSQENVVYLIDENGLQRSDDAGATFSAIKTLVEPSKMTTIDFIVDAGDDRIMYFTSGNAFHKTVNGGQTWRPVDLKFSRLITDIEVNPSNSSIIYLAVAKGEDKKSFFLPSL